MEASSPLCSPGVPGAALCLWFSSLHKAAFHHVGFGRKSSVWGNPLLLAWRLGRSFLLMDLCVWSKRFLLAFAQVGVSPCGFWTQKRQLAFHRGLFAKGFTFCFWIFAFGAQISHFACEHNALFGVSRRGAVALLWQDRRAVAVMLGLAP